MGTRQREDPAEQLASLSRLKNGELRALWQEVFGQPLPARVRRGLLLRALAYRIQERIQGVLSRATRSHLRRLAETAGNGASPSLLDAPCIKLGTRLIRQWQGETHEVTVIDAGFAYRGKRYLSLSEIARLITGTRVEILISKQGLRTALFGDTATPMALPSSGSRRAPRAEDDVLRLTIEARVKRCGGEVRMVVPAGTIVHEPARPVPSLIKAVARAHDWYSRMITGDTRYQSVIAEETGFDERYVSRIMKCAFLAPDIVEAILAGRQPPDLTLEKILYRLPSDWTEQRQLFGFPALPFK